MIILMGKKWCFSKKQKTRL